MSKALEIAETRFANGDISKEEFDEIRNELARDHNRIEQNSQPATAEITDDRAKKDIPSFNPLKYWWVAVIILMYLGYSSIKNELIVEKLASNSPLLGPTMVNATIYNKGSAKEYRYFVLKKPSKTEHCQGRFFIGENERKKLVFRCEALSSFTGRFSLITSTR